MVGKSSLTKITEYLYVIWAEHDECGDSLLVVPPSSIAPGVVQYYYGTICDTPLPALFFFLFKEASSRLWQYLLAFFFFPFSLTFYVLPPLIAQEVGMRRGDLLFAHLPLHVFLWYVTASAVAFAVVRSIPQHAKTKPAVWFLPRGEVRGREGEWTGEKNKGERERTPLLGRSMPVTFLPFSLQCAAAVVVGACEGREGQRGVMRARGVLPGRTVTGASHSPSVGTYLEDSSQTLGCSPISTAHSIQIHAFRLALRSQSNTHSSSSSSSSHRVRTVTISTTTSESHQGVHLVAFSSIRPVRVYARLCVCART